MLLFAIPHLLRNRPNAIILNSPPLTVGLVGIFLSKILRARTISNISDIWPLSALELGATRRGRIYSLLERIEKTVYQGSDAISVQSIETRDRILSLCADKRIFLYRNLDRPSAFIDRYPSLAEHPLRIVYAGLMGVAQGVLEICRQVDFHGIGAEFHLYGDGNERSEIERYVLENANCSIYVHDSVSKAKMPEILSTFHATIVPLKKHITGAFPSKIYMAMAASLPIFFCGAGEGAQFVRNLGIGWVSDASDYQGLTTHIRQLAAMEGSDYNALREKIKCIATNRFDLESQFDEFVKFIEAAN